MPRYSIPLILLALGSLNLCFGKDVPLTKNEALGYLIMGAPESSHYSTLPELKPEIYRMAAGKTSFWTGRMRRWCRVLGTQGGEDEVAFLHKLWSQELKKARPSIRCLQSCILGMLHLSHRNIKKADARLLQMGAQEQNDVGPKRLIVLASFELKDPAFANQWFKRLSKAFPEWDTKEISLVVKAESAAVRSEPLKNRPLPSKADRKRFANMIRKLGDSLYKQPNIKVGLVPGRILYDESKDETELKRVHPNPKDAIDSLTQQMGLSFSAIWKQMKIRRYDKVYKSLIYMGQPVERMKLQQINSKIATSHHFMRKYPAIMEGACDVVRIFCMRDAAPKLVDGKLDNVWVCARIKDTKGLGTAFYGPPDSPYTHTIDKDGHLWFVMLKKEGRWYWTPFGFDY